MVVNPPNSLHTHITNFQPYKFETNVNVPRVKHGNRQELESVISEEAMLLASFIRGKRIWEPRTVPLPNFVMPRMLEVIRRSQPEFQPFFHKYHQGE